MGTNQRSKYAGSVEIVVILFATLAVFSQASIPSTRTCHWCGPLAEQVHRSRRAPACSGAAPDHTTLCDPGLMHCAIVATAPPQVISRYCVKIYQDDCYSTFCNTTQTWKVTCPCQGDLCNGDVGEREKEAFVMLHKLAAKIKKNKRSVSAIVTENNGIGINETIDNHEDKTSENTNNNKDTTLKDNDTINNKDNVSPDVAATETSIKENENEVKLDNTINASKENIENSEGDKVNEMEHPMDVKRQNQSVHLDSQDETVINAVTPSITDETNNQIDNAVNAIKNVQDEINSARDKDSIENEVTKEIKSEMEDKYIIKKEQENPQIDQLMPTVMVPEPTILTTILEAKLSINNEETKQSISNVKPTEKMPPSESLQQNETPKVEKITTTYPTTIEESTTELKVDTTVKPKMRKNNAEKNKLQCIALFFSSITLVLNF